MEKPLIILEMANNHMGDLSHGKKIILEFNKLTKNYKKKLILHLNFNIETVKHLFMTALKIQITKE